MSIFIACLLVAVMVLIVTLIWVGAIQDDPHYFDKEDRE